MIRALTQKLVSVARNELVAFGAAKTTHDRDRSYARYQMCKEIIREVIPSLIGKDKEAQEAVDRYTKEAIDKLETGTITSSHEER